MGPKRLSRQSPEEALDSLYRRHLREIFGYSLALLGAPADAEDATQATFLNAYRALQEGERPRHANRWLRAIALNVCREQFRRDSRRPEEVSLDQDPAELVVDPPGPGIGDVIRALSHLPFNQRSALVMREFEGRPLADIAGRLGVTNSAVETLLFRARRALREQLDASLRCDQAEEAISRQLDGALPRSERGALRAHLRECPECASLARRLRGQRSTLKSLALVPVPASMALSKLGAPTAVGGGSSIAAGASIGSGGLVGLAIKTAGGTILAALAAGAGYATLRDHAPPPPRHAVTAAAGPRVATAARSASSAPAIAAVIGSKPGGGEEHSSRSGIRGRAPAISHGRSQTYHHAAAAATHGRRGVAHGRPYSPRGRHIGRGVPPGRSVGHRHANAARKLYRRGHRP